MYMILLMLEVQVFLLCSLRHPLSDLFSLSCYRAVLWQCQVAPVALLLLLGDKEVLVCSNTFILGTWIFQVKGTRLACLSYAYITYDCYRMHECHTLPPLTFLMLTVSFPIHMRGLIVV